MSNKTLNLYLLTQDEYRDYDTFDSCVVAAYSEEEAKKIHPFLHRFDKLCLPLDCDEWKRWDDSEYIYQVQWETEMWASTPDNVECKLIGIAAEGIEPNSVVCSSFNAVS